MFVPSNNVEFLVICVVLLCKPVEKCGNNIGVDMADKEAINVPAYGDLLAIDDFVGDTGIVGIDFESEGSKISNQFTIK